MSSRSSKMSNIVNYRLRITLSDSRILTGQMLAFDKHMNLVLADCEEFRKINKNAKDNSAANLEQKRTLGLVILRGETIVSMSIDGPPPPTTDDIRSRGPGLMAGPGMGRPMGRGLPAAPPPMGGPMAGLSGPVRGVGGPAPGMMQPRPGYQGAPVAYGRPPMPGQGMPPQGMPPQGFRPPPGMPPMGFRPPPGMPPPGFRPGMPPQGFPGAGRGAPPPGMYQRPPPQ
ncbi:hypothetical protein INT46_000213 [Mucor plumbeus]|uniref:Sm protein B n=1 Tax=Mucor plumbeus TaxID=97098 RepID=A0A8H7R8K7_9FUNG|nr:hypothetical protein INT46_000213 [Mucor plumbeus]